MGISERCIGEGMNIYYKEKYKGYPYPVGVFVYTAYPNTLLNKWYGEPNELQEYTEGLRVWSEGELTEAGFKHVRPKWFDDKQVYYEIELIEYFLVSINRGGSQALRVHTVTSGIAKR